MESDWLDPKHLKRELSRAGLFLLAYELLRAAVVDGVKNFYLIGFDEDGYTYAPEYTDEVLKLDKHPFAASLRWLVDSDAISDVDMDDIQAIREERNQVAHDAPQLLLQSGKIVSGQRVRDIERYVRKIDNYWGRVDAEIMLDPEQLEEVDMEGIVSNRAMILGYIVESLVGDGN